MGRRRKPWPLLVDLLEQARKNESGTPPRKHHLVPASYLRRWAEGGVIRVTDLDENNSYLCAPEKAARETDFYRIDHPDIPRDEVPPLVFETFLGHLEENAQVVADDLIRHQDARRVEEERLHLFAFHLGATLTRGMTFRQEYMQMTSSAFQVWASKWTEGHVVDALQREGRDISPELLEREFEALRDIQEGRVKALPSKEEAIGRAVQLAEPVAWSLLGRAWVVYRTPPIMMTSDEPIILIGGPGHPRGRRPGTETAGVVAYPLDPENLLVLFRPDMMPLGDPVLNHADMADINREVAASAFRWVFERGTRNAASKFVVPRRPEALSLIEGPLELSGQPSGEVFRFTRSNRWEVASVVPPWPVPRWWAR